MICGAADVAAVTNFCIIAGDLLLWVICANMLLLASLNGIMDIKAPHRYLLVRLSACKC